MVLWHMTVTKITSYMLIYVEIIFYHGLWYIGMMSNIFGTSSLHNCTDLSVLSMLMHWTYNSFAISLQFVNGNSSHKICWITKKSAPLKLIWNVILVEIKLRYQINIFGISSVFAESRIGCWLGRIFFTSLISWLSSIVVYLFIVHVSIDLWYQAKISHGCMMPSGNGEMNRN